MRKTHNQTPNTGWGQNKPSPRGQIKLTFPGFPWSVIPMRHELERPLL